MANKAHVSRKYRKILLIFIVVSIVALSGAAYVNYRLRSVGPVSFDSIETTDDGGVKINEISYSGTKNNRVAWELTAGSATHYREKQLTTLSNVKVVFFGENNVNYTLLGKEGSYDQSAGLVTASGGVTVTSTDGVTLKTEGLKYNEKSGELTTDDRVEVTSPELNASGTGVLVDVHNERLKIFADVRTEIKGAEK
jgi:LPS export ABC transporter protein LptC